MKKIILLTLCVASLFCSAQKRPAVIERPVFEVWSSSTIEIDKIEMSDSATIFHIDAYLWPGSRIAIDKGSFIRENGSDEKLILTHTEGLKLDENAIIPESGTLSFKLFFPPLKPGITKIDYMEDAVEGAWKIMGIHLLPDAKIRMEDIPNDVVNTASESLPAPTFSNQPVKISGRILGYIKDIAPSKITIYTMNSVTGDRTETELPVSDDGSFSGEVIPGIAGLYSSTIGNLFLEPGKDLKIYTDLKKRSRFQSKYRTDKEPDDSNNTYISGFFTGAELSVINQSTANMFDYQKLMQETVNMKPEEFKQHILGIMNKQLDDQKQKNYSGNILKMVNNTIKLSTFTLLMQYEAFISSAYMQVNKINPADMNKIEFKPEKPTDEYYSFLKGEITDEMSYLPAYHSLVVLLERLCGLPDGKDKPASERFAYFKEKVTPILGTNKGVLFDLTKVKYFGSNISNLKFFTDAEKKEVRESFKDNPAIAELLITENDKMQALLAANKDNKECILNETPEVSQEQLLDAIIAKYKGKVVLVDFWATWCAPCMVAMKSILPMKEEMKGKDVVFLYLTGETSPLAMFTKTYPTITGEHYRVSGDQWKYICTTHDIPAIPTYMVFDRQGKQISKHRAFPGMDALRKDIEKGL